MKRLGGIWEEIISMDNLRHAFRKASRGRHHLSSVRRVEKNLDNYLSRLHNSLSEGTFTTSGYKQFYIYEPKRRMISCLPFYPDRIVQHAILNILEGYWDRLMIFDSYSCRKDKGQHRGSNRCKEHVKKYRYAMQCDISKFYDSIDHILLKKILRKKVKDVKTLRLLDDIIDSTRVNLRGQRGVGVPIGSLLSQWFGNLYMNELDTYIKHELGCKPYTRYCDDFVLFSDNKQELHEWLVKITRFITDELHLKFSKSRIYPVSQGVDFLGYRHFRGYTLIRKRTVKRVKKRVRRIMALPADASEKIFTTAMGQLASMKGWIEHANAHHLMESLHFYELWEKYHGRCEAV